MLIKYATSEDLKSIASCHVHAFPDSITSRLGKNVVVSMLHWYLSGPNKFLFWVEENGKCIGYCGGHVIDGSDAYGSASGMTQFGFNKAIIGFLLHPWLLFHPEVMKKYNFIFLNILRKLGLKKPQQKKQTPTPPSNQPLTAGLVVIGVLPNLQQKGIGTTLQQEFERKAISLGAKRLQLSVRKENERAILSYKRNGYSVQGDQEVSYLMTKDL